MEKLVLLYVVGILFSYVFISENNPPVDTDLPRTPYMEGQAFRYAEASRFLVTDVQERPEGEFLIVSR